MNNNQTKPQQLSDIDMFLPSTTNSSILDALYEETPIITELSFEDFLKLPLNDKYKQFQEEQNIKTEDRFKIIKKEEIENIISNPNNNTTQQRIYHDV